MRIRNVMLILAMMLAIIGPSFQNESDEEEEEVAANKRKNNDNGDVDYFYDAALSQNEIDRIKKEREEADEKAKLELEKNKKIDEEPEWFKEAKDNSKDPMEAFMKQQIDEYLKKYRKEQIEKLKSKSKSELNHQMWSIITLTTFFGSGIVIGLLIVFIRGRQSSFKTKKKILKGNLDATKSKAIYKNVDTSDQIVI